jgi:hypothetical protein
VPRGIIEAGSCRLAQRKRCGEKKKNGGGFHEADRTAHKETNTG